MTQWDKHCDYNGKTLQSFPSLVVLSTDNLCKQFGPRSGFGSKPFDMKVFMKEFFEKKLILKVLFLKDPFFQIIWKSQQPKTKAWKTAQHAKI